MKTETIKCDVCGKDCSSWKEYQEVKVSVKETTHTFEVCYECFRFGDSQKCFKGLWARFVAALSSSEVGE